MASGLDGATQRFNVDPSFGKEKDRKKNSGANNQKRSGGFGHKMILAELLE
jgi:hypothetical protein